MPAAVRTVAAKGRKVFVLLAQCPVDACMSRAKARALSDGRYVPIEVIKSKEGMPEKALEATIATGNLRTTTWKSDA